MSDEPELLCAGCDLPPAECGYDYFASLEDCTPDEYVLSEEGTLDYDTGKFLCDRCYIRHGQPSGPASWTATPANLQKIGL